MPPSDMPFNEAAVRHGTSADDRHCRKPAAAGRPRLGGARLQNPVPSHCPASDLQGKSAERGQKTLAVNIPYRGAKGPLHLLIDSTRIKVEGEGEWHARKLGGPKRRVWRKIHLGIDEETLEVRAVEITGSHIGDAPGYPTCSTRSRRTSRSAASLPTVPTTPANATMQSLTVAPTLSSRPARTPNRGRPSPPARSHETKHCGHRNTSVVPSGDDGADTTADAASKRRCTA